MTRATRFGVPEIARLYVSVTPNPAWVSTQRDDRVARFDLSLARDGQIEQDK